MKCRILLASMLFAGCGVIDETADATGNVVEGTADVAGSAVRGTADITTSALSAPFDDDDLD